MEKIHEIGKYMVGGDFLGVLGDFFWGIKGVGVKKIMEKIHDKGKYMVGGDFFGRFGKIQHTFQGFFPGPP